MAKNTYSIQTSGIHKSFGKVEVLKGVDLKVGQGTILALLGPNGAGKTTMIRILSTLLEADSGTASIEGFDLKKQADKVRGVIGLTGQYAAVDEYLTARENLKMMGRLYHMSKADSDKRADELVRDFDMVEFADRTAKTYSGGMKRRLDLAMSLIANPPVIFLDEPTTGLDPRSRATMWAEIKKMAQGGTTILLTTQYMEEADNLADNIVVIDDGKVIAEGTSDELKAKIGSDRLEITIAKEKDFKKAVELLNDSSAKSDAERRVVSIATKAGIGTLRQVLQQLETAKIDVESISLHRPTLDDVFLTLTGKSTATDEEASNTKGKK